MYASVSVVSQHMAIEYSIRSESENSAKILLHGKAIAHLQTKGNDVSSLETLTGRIWEMTRRVDREIRPFSLLIRTASKASQNFILKIKDHLFAYGGKMYMFGAVPEGTGPHLHLRGTKFIGRLDGFPFQDPDQVDLETKNRLKRLRGVPVGEFTGIGKKTHLVKLEKELEPIGLQLAAACFVLYSTH